MHTTHHTPHTTHHTPHTHTHTHTHTHNPHKQPELTQSDSHVVAFQERRTPGNAVAVSGDKPFRGLAQFGTAFLNKFECSQCPSPILQNLTFIDTPGVLSGDKQRIGRSYDFVRVMEWFAEKSDLILLLFDAHKLDISDEFKVWLCRGAIFCCLSLSPRAITLRLSSHHSVLLLAVCRAP